MCDTLNVANEHQVFAGGKWLFLLDMVIILKIYLAFRLLGGKKELGKVDCLEKRSGTKWVSLNIAFISSESKQRRHFILG